MKKLGVLVLSDPSKGGTFQYTLSMLEGLQYVNEWQITLYTTSDNENYNDTNFPIRIVNSNFVSRIPSLARLIINTTKIEPFVDEDVILAPIYSPLLLHTQKPFVYTLHDLQELYYPHFFSFAQRYWRHFIHAQLTKKAACIICESNFVKRDIEQAFQVPPKKITVIVAPPLPVQSKENILSGTKIREKYNLPTDFLFYPAQFWAHKNHKRLIKAFARISVDYPNYQLVLTGKKRDEYYKVFSLVEKLGLRDHVRHIGYVDQCDISGLYREAIALILPSLFESVSIPVFEAFIHDTPIAVSNVVALPEQVGEAGLLFDPLSIDSITIAIRKLLDDPKLRKHLSEKGRKRYESLTFDKNGIELENMLTQLYINSSL